jgi:hypothetical protein
MVLIFGWCSGKILAWFPDGMKGVKSPGLRELGKGRRFRDGDEKKAVKPGVLTALGRGDGRGLGPAAVQMRFSMTSIMP